MIDRESIAFQAKCELSRRSFWEYCKFRSPDFYKDDRAFLVDLCNTLQSFYEGKDRVLVINMPPRFGKSRTAQLFVQWVLGHNPIEQVMTGSYNEMLSTTFAKSVRNTIMEIKAEPLKAVYTDIFPGVAIRKGDASMNLWSLDGAGHHSYLATSPGGTATGFGCTLMLLDDIIKNAEEAYNENVLEKHWEWFINTMFSRLEEGGKMIFIMTRWATDDLAGKALEHFTRLGLSVRHINYKAVQDDGTMLCEDILSRESFDIKMHTSDKAIVSANYQQEPIDLEGRLYTSFKTYDGVLPEFRYIWNETDTADEGEDYLCSICYGVTFNNEAYILDIYYTNDHMEVTEQKTAEMLVRNDVGDANIESNNGGRGFGRQVERIMRDNLHNNRCRINTYHQSKNKEARILSNATWVMDHIYYPSDWMNRWNDYYMAMLKYQREGKNKHDDAPDCTTSIAERLNKPKAISF